MIDRNFATKPDIEEPWRYVCPECEHQVYASSSAFRCQHCGDTYAKSDLKDKK